MALGVILAKEKMMPLAIYIFSMGRHCINSMNREMLRGLLSVLDLLRKY